MSSSCVQNGTLSNGTLHHFWTSSKWDHHWFEPFFNQKSRFYPWFILLYRHCIHSNGKFYQFYCKAYCKSISFSVPIATNLVKQTAVSQLDYSLSLWHINICSPQSILHKNTVGITVLLWQKREVRFPMVNKFAQGYMAIKDRARILRQVDHARSSAIYPIPYNYKMDLASSDFKFFLLNYIATLYLKEEWPGGYFSCLWN